MDEQSVWYFGSLEQTLYQRRVFHAKFPLEETGFEENGHIYFHKKIRPFSKSMIILIESDLEIALGIKRPFPFRNRHTN